MIVDLHEKYDVDPNWFEEQCKRDPEEAWSERLCELLSVYRVKDIVGAEEAAEKMIAVGVDEALVKAAME